MKRLLPLLFLLPSVALILHARRASVPQESYQLDIEVTTGAYAVPDEYEIQLVTSGPPQRVENGRATLRFPEAGDVTVHVMLVARGAETAVGVAHGLGEPREFTLKETSEPQRKIIVVTREECESAIARLKTAR